MVCDAASIKSGLFDHLCNILCIGCNVTSADKNEDDNDVVFDDFDDFDDSDDFHDFDDFDDFEDFTYVVRT